MTDEQVNTVFGKAGVTTNAQLTTQIEKDLKQQLYSAEVDKIKSYMIDNSTVEILMSIYRPDSMSILLHLPRKMSRMDRHLRNI